jgi:predicted nucleotidyltransferase
MIQVVKNHIDLIVERISEHINMEEVIVFGSYAYGEPNDDSDIDLCVVLADEFSNKRSTLKQIRKLVSPLMKYPLDILLYNREEFYQRANTPTTLEHKISEEGVKIYG